MGRKSSSLQKKKRGQSIMVTSRARERRSQEDHHIGPWLEGKARGKNGNPREIRFEETRAQRKREELSCCDDDD